MKPLAVLFCGLLFATTVGAEVVYVDDSLRVGVRTRPGNTESPQEVVTSGATLEVLERGENGYMRVRTASGIEGWVSSVYVTTQPPARMLLEEVKQENVRLQSELRTLRGGAAPAEQSVAPPSSELDDLRRENALLVSRLSELTTYANGRDWTQWAKGVAILIGLFVFGVFLGKRHERQRVASRFNGLQL